MQRSLRPFAKVPFKATFAAQPERSPVPDPGTTNHVAVILPDYLNLEARSCPRIPQFSAESLDADKARRLIVA
jgi:hypothetical protein